MFCVTSFHWYMLFNGFTRKTKLNIWSSVFLWFWTFDPIHSALEGLARDNSNCYIRHSSYFPPIYAYSESIWMNTFQRRLKCQDDCKKHEIIECLKITWMAWGKTDQYQQKSTLISHRPRSNLKQIGFL